MLIRESFGKSGSGNPLACLKAKRAVIRWTAHLLKLMEQMLFWGFRQR